MCCPRARAFIAARSPPLRVPPTHADAGCILRAFRAPFAARLPPLRVPLATLATSSLPGCFRLRTSWPSQTQYVARLGRLPPRRRFPSALSAPSAWLTGCGGLIPRTLDLTMAEGQRAAPFRWTRIALRRVRATIIQYAGGPCRPTRRTFRPPPPSPSPQLTQPPHEHTWH